MIALFIYLIAINIVCYAMFGYDKAKAKGHGRRVPEKRLFLVAALGGAFGGWLGMQAFRHKTKHSSFVVGIPALIFVNGVCVYLILKAIL